VPARKEILDVPPPEAGGLRSAVEIVNCVTDLMVLPVSPAASTRFGLLTICCVIWGMSVAGVRKIEGVLRSCSGNVLIGLFGFPIGNGKMSVAGKDKGTVPAFAVPCETKEVP